MSNRAFRATVDFTLFDEDDNPIGEELLAEAGSAFGDEQLGRALNRAIESGIVEIDAISDIEDHG